MSNKSNRRVAMDLALTTAENITDEIVFKTATTLIEDLVKSVPFSPIVTSLISAYSNFETAKKQRQLLNFIQKTEALDHGFIAQFFREKSNSELGFEILGILDQTYLDKQARMVSRAVILLHKDEISKQEFDKYTYIITKLNNHLLTLIEELHTKFMENSPKVIISLPKANMDLASFGFIQKLLDGSWFAEAQNETAFDYKITNEYFYFYKNIFKD